SLVRASGWARRRQDHLPVRPAALLLAFEHANISAEAAARQLSGRLLYVALPRSNSQEKCEAVFRSELRAMRAADNGEVSS
ncbi:hypothetical protein, partial [Mesorhizobium sp. M2A.F.Ca.ET.039.01.1.1]|uniref:hypothetical protein n=1 Tax=Mesorhizobium sp. M2A.F.Ca.ET.039.01.1.1 TaxID=2496746 RepID=UPI001AECB704